MQVSQYYAVPLEGLVLIVSLVDHSENHHLVGRVIPFF